jgi:hypothetical protein
LEGNKSHSDIEMLAKCVGFYDVMLENRGQSWQRQTKANSSRGRLRETPRKTR